MSSGVTVSSDAKTVYDEVKKDKKYRYIIYHIKDERVIDVESIGARDVTYTEFLEILRNYQNECRYCVFDFPANIAGQGMSALSVDRLVLMTWCPESSRIGTTTTSADTGMSALSVDRLVLMTWCPESSRIRQKMLYSSSYGALKKALVGVYKYVRASDVEGASQQIIEEAFRKGSQ
ncbi:unnamed protein product [Oppiella nova]|uniref:ADF-H domain-containing protein n=1 Tax=Oppiella nova TaxID=334625 RepID=A0A7R9LIQ2_9ACAR|nr:unnamed protein product [Oppiella nova]CAG2164054.1 unnamed protein product [Oppiella nova]